MVTQLLTEYLPVSYAAMWKNSSLAWNIKNSSIEELRVTNYASLKVYFIKIIILFYFECAMAHQGDRRAMTISCTQVVNFLCPIETYTHR